MWVDVGEEEAIGRVHKWCRGGYLKFGGFRGARTRRPETVLVLLEGGCVIGFYGVGVSGPVVRRE